MALHIKDLLHNFTKVQNNNHWKIKLLQEWGTIVGHLATHVRLEKINEDNLVISVDDSSWMHELYCLSNILITTINKSLDKPRITSLRFKNKGYSAPAVARKLPKQFEHSIQHRKLSDKETTVLKKITDQETQEALKKFLFKCEQKDVG